MSVYNTTTTPRLHSHHTHTAAEIVSFSRRRQIEEEGGVFGRRIGGCAAQRCRRGRFQKRHPYWRRLLAALSLTLWSSVMYDVGCGGASNFQIDWRT